MSRTAAILTLASIFALTPISLLAQGYGGPSLLSRGGNSSGKRGRSPVNITPYVAVRGIYETGLIAPQLDEFGNLIPQSWQGMQVEFGAYGAKSWRRSSLGLDYRGDYRAYGGTSVFNGTNQALSIDAQTQLSRRYTAYGRVAAGTTNRAFGAFSAPAFGNQDTFGVPLDEVYDSRVYFGQVSGGIGYRASAKTSYRFNSDIFASKRIQQSLISTQGYRTGVDLQHTLSRNTQIGVGYNFIHFSYPRVYGGSDIHNFFTGMQRAVTRNLDLILQVGLYHATTTGTQSITLSPEVAAVLGRTQGVEAFQRSSIAPQIIAGVNYTLERSRLRATYDRSITPGNGIYIASLAEHLSAGYSYSGIRHLSLGASLGFSRTNSLGITLDNLTMFRGGGGLTYKFSRYWALDLQADGRTFDSPGFKGRNGITVSFGISFSPADVPISIW